jgi:hypothetical protein
MHAIALILGVVCCSGVALDALQTIILPRRPTGRFRITRIFYILTWEPLVAITEHFPNHKTRERIYSAYGPISLLLLLAFWATMLVTGYALLYFGLGTPFSDALNPHGPFWASARTDLYVSGTTLFTLGLGDVTPQRHLARLVVVLESATGLGFVALVIGYLPVLYQAFSHREVSVAMLDGRAGSPPTATELLRRHGHEGGEKDLALLLAEWERWSAEILETHISYPLLCYYRSQHDNQSWLSGLVAVLDACALLITTIEGPVARQAQLTFAMGRHALLDVGHVFHLEKVNEVLPPKRDKPTDRLPQETFYRLCGELGDIHMRLCGDPAAQQRLTAMRALYEPHAQILSDYLKMPLPLWVPEPRNNDAWKKVADLRMGAGAQETLLGRSIQHVSDRSTATHLHDEEHGF